MAKMLLKEARKRKGISLYTLGGKLRISPSYLSKLENVRETSPSHHVLTCLAAELEIDADALFISYGRIQDDMIRWLSKRPKLVARLRRRMTVPL